MNHIYKTILNKKTRKIQVVSEKSSNSYKNKRGGNLKLSKITVEKQESNNEAIKEPVAQKSKLAFSVGLVLMTLCSSNLFAAITYTGNTDQLIDSDSIDGYFDQLVGSSTDKGLTELDNTVIPSTPISSGAVITIDYSIGDTPNFILAGYAPVNADDDPQNAVASNNSITLKQGDIHGNIYAGLAHSTTVIPPIDCSNISTICDEKTTVTNKTLTSSKNTINVLDEHSIKVTKSINTGYAEINIAYDNITAGADNSATNASTNISTDTSSNVLNANENKISILGQNNTLNDLNVGAAGININHGDITAGTANANTGFFAFSDATVNTNANANANAIKLNTNINTISILSQNNIFNDLKVGDTGINISYGNITAGTANSDSTSFTAANAKADAQANVVDNELNANENEISILGNNNIFNDLNIGDAEINLSYGNITAGIANANSPTPTGNAPTEVDINAFNNRLNADANKISISGQNNTLNNITAGHAGINIKFGDITGGKTIVNGETSFSDASLTIDASDTALSASNNSISLEGSSTINGSLYAGYIDFNIDYGAIKKGDGSDVTPDINLTGTKAFATNNTMTIEGSHDVTNLDASIYGGYLSANAEHQPESYDVFTGNTLNYNNRTPIKIGALGNFQTYNFSLNPELANTDTALITAKNVNLGSNKSNTSADSVVASDIYVVGIQSGKPVATDSKFILIQADKDQLTGVGQGHASKGVAQQGISLLYDVETQIDQEKDQVIAIINTGHNQEPSVNPQLKALLEGNLSGLMLLTRSADELSNNLFSAINDQNHQRGLVPFIIMSGNHVRYDTGSDIKSDGALLTGGLSLQDEQWTAGVFIENGWDSYKTSNSFEDAADIHGKGHNSFNGIGIYGRYDFNNGWYADGTLRGGRLQTAFSSDDLRNAITGERAEYNISSTYYGVYLTGGYMLALDQQNDLDLSLKYLWSGTQSQDLVIAGDPIHFNKLNSQRLRLNAENNYKINPEFTLLTGLGYEYEFDGKAGGTTYDLFDIDQASVKGSTGIATLGVRYEPKSNERFSMDLKGSGFFGKREGGSAMLHLKYAF